MTMMVIIMMMTLLAMMMHTNAIQEARGIHPSKPMMHFAYSHILTKFINFPLFLANILMSPYFRSIDVFRFPPILTMMHKCVMVKIR